MKVFLLAGFKLNLTNLLTSHVINYSLRRTIFNEVFDNVDLMKHLFAININHIDFFYGSILISSIFFYYKDLQYKKSFNNLENNLNLKKVKNNIELLLLILILLLTKNVENAT